MLCLVGRDDTPKKYYFLKSKNQKTLRRIDKCFTKIKRAHQLRITKSGGWRNMWLVCSTRWRVKAVLRIYNDISEINWYPNVNMLGTDVYNIWYNIYLNYLLHFILQSKRVGFLNVSVKFAFFNSYNQRSIDNRIQRMNICYDQTSFQIQINISKYSIFSSCDTPRCCFIMNIFGMLI